MRRVFPKRSKAAYTASAAFSVSCPLDVEKGYMLRLGKKGLQSFLGSPCLKFWHT